MYGWRARLGVLVPSGILATEPDFNRVVPEGVCCHFHRFKFEGGGSPEDVVRDLKAAGDDIVETSMLIADARPHVICMAGTATSFIGGFQYDQQLIAKLRAAHGNIPATTTSTSVIDALRRLGIKKVSIAMPYVEEVSRAAAKFVADNGIEVVKAEWLNKAGFDIPMIPNETVYELARQVDTPETEAIFISCTAMHTFDVIQLLENDLGKPVVTSNQATIWNLLRLAGIQDKITGYGRLLAEY
jgi:maleate isomerase